MTKILVGKNSKSMEQAKLHLASARKAADTILNNPGESLRDWLMAEAFALQLENAMYWAAYRGKQEIDFDEIQTLTNEELVQSIRYSSASLMRQR